MFSWDNPPDGGHIGEDYNCRCRAEPYYGDGQEYLTHNLKGLGGSNSRWENLDFVNHFYRGAGRGVRLSEVGHLREIAEYWAYSLGALDRWTNQIVASTCKGQSAFFSASYDFGNVEFSHGGGTVQGGFSGTTQVKHGMMMISGERTYQLSDVFTDPANIRSLTGNNIPDWAFNVTDLFGTAYEITASWRSDLKAKVFVDQNISVY